LRRVERRLQALIRELLADQYGGRVSPRVAERFRLGPPVPPDTVRVAAPAPDTIARDTITVVDTVRVPPDTIRDTRIEMVERRLLDTGVFRGFEVNFAFGKSILQPRATRTLNAVGAVLQRYPDLRLEIGGHTDAVGPEGVNQRLSEARADAARTYLLSRFDIATDRLVAQGYGESRPVASNEERSGRALNRRVEFRVLNPAAVP
jgi:outer membrane protein OmpA-like peptidoglycan-associated protein